ncbi:hypothetical protein [Bradyrhizobium sp. CCGUVB23]|uniref:hypothetical protein n=1 Tax=Bradyrhizobium sp. CCGUVB23 TaxID=2949630 RepID=UPI0020B3E2A2|nr:hypothetical protein [Bradyrhizobium sp. CCGUVB23]MCP3460503.1 hypothetical protein [Bradyrhizobium sp. CCGUVB23]
MLEILSLKVSRLTLKQTAIAVDAITMTAHGSKIFADRRRHSFVLAYFVWWSEVVENAEQPYRLRSLVVAVRARGPGEDGLGHARPHALPNDRGVGLI